VSWPLIFRLLFGLLVAGDSTFTLWSGLKPGGEMPSRWPFKNITREANPGHFWTTTIIYFAACLGGLVLIVTSLLKYHPNNYLD
jgi:hypothetical protein